MVAVCVGIMVVAYLASVVNSSVKNPDSAA
jgi:hypothetical protein